MIRQVDAGFGNKRLPVAAIRKYNTPLISHLDEEEIGDLLDIIPVIDPVMPERVAESPEFLDYIAHADTDNTGARINPAQSPVCITMHTPVA